MPPKKSQAVQPCPIGTRASNKLAHPGEAIKSSVPHRSSAEVRQAREAKAKAKANREEAKKQAITRAAEFEHTDMANEDMANATPRLPFTPKPWPPPRNKKKATKPVPATVSNEDDKADFDNESLSSAPSSVTEDESESLTESDSDDPAPPAKKQKMQATQNVRGSGIVADSERGGKVDKKASSEDETWLTRTPMPKKKSTSKPKVRDEIDLAAKKMGNEVKGDKYRDMAPVSPCLITVYMLLKPHRSPRQQDKEERS